MANRKLEQNVRKYYSAVVKLTIKFVNAMRLATRVMPENLALETKEWLRNMIFVLAFFLSPKSTAVGFLN